MADYTEFSTKDEAEQVLKSVRLMELERNRRRANMHLDALPVIASGVTERPATYGRMAAPAAWFGKGMEPWWKFQIRLDTGTDINTDPAKVQTTDYYAKRLAANPLKSSFVRVDEGGRHWYMSYNDDLETTKAQIRQDAINSAAGKPFEPLKTLDEIVPYTGMRLEADELKRSLGYLQDQEEAAVNELLRTKTATEAALIAGETVTDPLGRALVEKLVGQAATTAEKGGLAISPFTINPTAALLAGIGVDLAKTTQLDIDPNVKREANLPVMGGNVLTQQQEAQRQLDIAAQATALATYSGAQQEAENAAVHQAADLNYWKANYPTVTIRPEDNPQLPRQMLYAEWPMNKPGAPLVNVEVTPRAKPMPEMGFLAKNPWVGAVASIIPVVGQVAAIGITIGSQLQAKDYQNSFNVEADQFKPQYQPKPFYVVLPLDQAQLAVKQPWYIEPLVMNFLEDVRASQLAAAQALFRQPVLSGSTPTRTTIPLTTPGPATPRTSTAARAKTKPKPQPMATTGIGSRFLTFGSHWP